jgi:hypothetical protein
VAGWAAALSAVLRDEPLRARLTEAGAAAAAVASWKHGAAILGGLLSAVADGRLTRPVNGTARR